MSKLIRVDDVYLVETVPNCYRGVDWRYDPIEWVNKALGNQQNIVNKSK